MIRNKHTYPIAPWKANEANTYRAPFPCNQQFRQHVEDKSGQPVLARCQSRGRGTDWESDDWHNTWNDCDHLPKTTQDHIYPNQIRYKRTNDCGQVCMHVWTYDIQKRMFSVGVSTCVHMSGPIIQIQPVIQCLRYHIIPCKANEANTYRAPFPI